MNISSLFALREAEKKFFEEEKRLHPELFERSVLAEDDDLLAKIGIEGVFGPRERGHIKLFPEDFIVEEITKDHKILSVTDEETTPETASAEEEIRTVWAELVKMGIDTIGAVNELSERLGIEKKFIGTAGIKDKHALTAQAISFRGIRPEELSRIKAENYFLKDVSMGKGALQTGDLAGNRFTIFIRTPGKPDEEKIKETLRDLEEQGFWNFFYLQRFGTPRLMSHKLGLLILRGDFEGTAKTFLGFASENEIPYFRNLRARIVENWGKWDQILKILEPLPCALSHERRVAEYLARNNADYAGALSQIPEQVKLWVYAYASFLFNKKLSDLISRGGEIPFSLPAALSRYPRTKDYYGDYFKAHKISPPFPALKQFPFVQKAEKEIEVLKQFVLHDFKTIPSGVILDFSLDKGSYATTFLSHLFVLSSGEPVPEGISLEEIDSKAVLGTGTIMPLKTGAFRILFEMRNKKDEGEGFFAEE